MIIVIIGQSASGKTSYAKKNFIDGELTLKDKPVKHTICNNTLLIGHYGIGRRCEGSDTTGLNQIQPIIDLIKDNEDKFNTIVAEGDRINNNRFFEFLKGKDVKVILFECSLETSMKRLKKEGSNIQEQFVKTTQTKSLNNFRLAQKLGFQTERINTDDTPTGLGRFLKCVV